MIKGILVDVRADFLSSGQIIPLFYFDEYGKQTRIDRIIFTEVKNYNHYYTCRVKSENINLIFSQNRWYLIQQ